MTHKMGHLSHTMGSKFSLGRVVLWQVVFGPSCPGPEVIKSFMLISAELEIFRAHKCLNANNCWHFSIYKQEK